MVTASRGTAVDRAVESKMVDSSIDRAREGQIW